MYKNISIEITVLKHTKNPKIIIKEKMEASKLDKLLCIYCSNSGSQPVQVYSLILCINILFFKF